MVAATPMTPASWLAALTTREWVALGGAGVLLLLLALVRALRWWRYHPLYLWSGHRRPISDRVRWRIFAAAGYRCEYCGHFGDGDHPLEVDHARPVAAGGDHHPSNLVAACRPCNREKGARM